jgi:hypothetical protein
MSEEIELIARALDCIPDQHVRMTAAQAFRRLVATREVTAMRGAFDAMSNELTSSQKGSDLAQSKPLATSTGGWRRASKTSTGVW